MDTSKVVEKLKEYMAENNLAAKQLAGKLGWTPGDLGAILGGHKTIGKNRLLHISKTLGITFEIKKVFVAEGLPGEPVPPPLPGDIPVVAFVKGGDKGFFDEQGYPVGQGFRKTKRPYDVKDPNAYGVEVRGTSMAPKFEERETLIASPAAPVVNGDYVVARTTKDESMVKRIYFRDGLIVLESFNEPPLIYKKEEVLFYHKVVWVKQRG